MLTGKDYLKEHIEETNIPEEHWENEIGEMMDAYADYYHKAELKLLNLHLVDCQREQLNAAWKALEFVGFERNLEFDDDDIKEAIGI